MFTTCSSANLHVTKELVVKYERSLGYAGVYSTASMYSYVYNRIRTMEYEYLGLTKAAALNIAQQMNNWLIRHVAIQEWQSSYGRFAVPYVTADSSGISDTSLANMLEIRAGIANPEQDTADLWKISVSFDEQIEYWHTAQAHDQLPPAAFADFERSPETESAAYISMPYSGGQGSAIFSAFKRHTDGLTGSYTDVEMDFPVMKDLWTAA